MNEDNDGCVLFLEQQGLSVSQACNKCILEITPCAICSKPVVFEQTPLPKGCPLRSFFKKTKPEGLREYDVCEVCGDHICPECQDNAKVGWGVFDSLCKACGKDMKKSDYVQ